MENKNVSLFIFVLKMKREQQHIIKFYCHTQWQWSMLVILYQTIKAAWMTIFKQATQQMIIVINYINKNKILDKFFSLHFHLNVICFNIYGFSFWVRHEHSLIANVFSIFLILQNTVECDLACIAQWLSAQYEFITLHEAVVL